MKVPISRGRAFTSGDTEKSPPVAIVNEVMAARFWPNQNPGGRRFRAGDPDSPLIEVIGVNKQGKYGNPADEPTPFFYRPQAQAPTTYRRLQLRAAVGPPLLLHEVQRQIS